MIIEEYRMLVQLSISNFAIISRLEINFKTGLNILSGETGAGKSIIINAVNLILGGRVSSDLIRSGADEAKVEALFSLPENASIKKLLSDLDFPFNGELVIRRTISRQGRNRIMINGSLATLQMLGMLGVMLISISGQHEHQLLLKPENHLYLLDDFGALTGERLSLGESFGAYQSLKERVKKLEKEIREQEERQDLTGFQINEIESAGIMEGEDSLMEEEKKRLRYGKQLMETVTASYQALYEREDSVLSGISLCIRDLEKGAEMDDRLGSIRDTLASARVEMEDAALELRDHQKTIVIDPDRLEVVEDRIQLINRLKKKYGPSLEDILEYKDKLSGMVDNLDQQREELKRMDQRLRNMERDIISRASLLSSKRKKVAGRLKKSVEDELNLLDMKDTRFEVCFHGEDLDDDNRPENMIKTIRAEGFDRAEFMLSSNIGEQLKPLSKIASGGELSRIMLALKTILARTGSVETVIFDEVDSGIGGATAEVVGEKLRSLADYHQILCITHLPQIASKGETHFLVQKSVKTGRTLTTISELDTGKRINEIARLLGGKVITQQAMAHAKEMINC